MLSRPHQLCYDCGATGKDAFKTIARSHYSPANQTSQVGRQGVLAGTGPRFASILALPPYGRLRPKHSEKAAARVSLYRQLGLCLGSPVAQSVPKSPISVRRTVESSYQCQSNQIHN